MGNQKFYLILFIIMLQLPVMAKTGDTLHVVTHHATTVVTDPSKGFRPYKSWGVFLVQLITDPGGVIVEEHIYNDLKEASFTYDLSHYPKTRFYLKVYVNGMERFNKRIRYRE